MDAGKHVGVFVEELHAQGLLSVIANVQPEVTSSSLSMLSCGEQC